MGPIYDCIFPTNQNSGIIQNIDIKETYLSLTHISFIIIKIES